MFPGTSGHKGSNGGIVTTADDDAASRRMRS
jgi:hypothetical protein